MVETNRSRVEDALAAWREAERALEHGPQGDDERPRLRAEVERLRARYQRAVLASRGRVDQLEAAAESTWDRLESHDDERVTTLGERRDLG